MDVIIHILNTALFVLSLAKDCFHRFNCFVLGRVATASLNCKNLQRLTKTSFAYSIILIPRLFKLTSVSPLTNSCPKQKTVAKAKQKTFSSLTDIHSFHVFFCLSSSPCVSSLSVVLCDCRLKIHDHLQSKLSVGSHVFSSQKNKSCMQSICADVRGYFHPNFHYVLWCLSTLLLLQSTYAAMLFIISTFTRLKISNAFSEEIFHQTPSIMGYI